MSANSLKPALADANADIVPILKMLRIFNEGEQNFNAYAALLKYGRQFRHVDCNSHALRKGESRQCYKNCTSALMQFAGDRDPPYLYAEGYALDAELGIPYQHAWLVDATGKAIDLTWHKTDGAVYYGITFKVTFVLEAMRLTGVYGVLFNLDLHARLFSDEAAFASTISRPPLPGRPPGKIT